MSNLLPITNLPTDPFKQLMASFYVKPNEPVKEVEPVKEIEPVIETKEETKDEVSESAEPTPRKKSHRKKSDKGRHRKHRRHNEEQGDEEEVEDTDESESTNQISTRRNPDKDLLKHCNARKKIQEKIRKQEEVTDDDVEEVIDEENDGESEEDFRRRANLKLSYYYTKYGDKMGIPENFRDLDIDSLKLLYDNVSDSRQAGSMVALVQEGYGTIIALLEVTAPHYGYDLEGATVIVTEDTVIQDALEDLAIEMCCYLKDYTHPGIILALATVSTLKKIDSNNKKEKKVAELTNKKYIPRVNNNGTS